MILPRPSLTLLLSLACLTGVVESQDVVQSACIGCHIEQDDPYFAPAEMFPADVHAQAGLGCESCHGGDPTSWDYDEAKDPSTNFRGVPIGAQIVELCGVCHSSPEIMRRYNPNIPVDQVVKYWTSGHGKSLRAGHTGAAQCASCHHTHAIKRITDPTAAVYPSNVSQTCGACHADANLMERFDLPADIVEHYTNSVHGVALLERGDPAAPTCNTCHGNHGATPPEVGSIQDICGSCHVNNQALFDQTKMKSMFVSEGLHGCAVCHTAHDIMPAGDEMIGFGDSAVCLNCHQPDDPGAMESRRIRAVLDSLAMRLHAAENAVRTAESRGLEIEDLLFDMQSVQTALVQSRTMVHTFNAAWVRAEAAPGMVLATEIMQEVEQIIDEFRMRKIGLGIATLLISFLALVLYLYIRTLE